MEAVKAYRVSYVVHVQAVVYFIQEVGGQRMEPGHSRGSLSGEFVTDSSPLAGCIVVLHIIFLVLGCLR